MISDSKVMNSNFVFVIHISFQLNISRVSSLIKGEFEPTSEGEYSNIN
jgi:hypothetical protein